MTNYIPFHVLQISSYHCFPACLESFLKDNQVSITQKEIVDKFPDLFAKTSTIEGAFSDNNLKNIKDEFGFNLSEVTKPIVTKPPKESIFVMCEWGGDPSKVHWVRFVKSDKDYIYFMNPSCRTFPCKIAKADFRVWRQRNYLLTKI